MELSQCGRGRTDRKQSGLIVSGYQRPGKKVGRVHSADLHAQRMVDSAVRFAAHIRTSPYETHRIDADTLAKARDAATKLNAQYGKFGRRAIVYAITKDGTSWPVASEG